MKILNMRIEFFCLLRVEWLYFYGRFGTPICPGCPETSVRNYHHSLRNSPGERILIYFAAEA
jgi:hypothetical protein